MQLALCKVLFPRLRGQSVCPFTFSVLLMMWEMLSVEHKRASSPSHSNECHSQNESVGVTCLLGGRKKNGRKFVRLPFFICTLNLNGEEGNHCHTSRSSTKPPDCILDSDMLFFFPLQGNQMFLHSVTDSLPDCPRTPFPPSSPAPHILNPTPALLFSHIPASQFAVRWISVYCADWRLNRTSYIHLS